MNPEIRLGRQHPDLPSYACTGTDGLGHVLEDLDQVATELAVDCDGLSDPLDILVRHAIANSSSEAMESRPTRDSTTTRRNSSRVGDADSGQPTRLLEECHGLIGDGQ